MDLEETKRKVKYVTSEIQKSDWEGVENGLLDIVVHIQKAHQDLADSTPRNPDIAALIQEMRHGFDSMDKRFEAMDKRFEAMDKRFEAMDKRFEAMDKRFDDLIHQMDKRFESMDKRFESMDKRFDDLIHYMDKRFELLTSQMDKRFEQVDKRFNTIFWMMGIGFTFFSFIITYGTFFKN